MTYQSINPADGAVLKKFEDLTDEQLETRTRDRPNMFQYLAAQNLCRSRCDRDESRCPAA